MPLYSIMRKSGKSFIRLFSGACSNTTFQTVADAAGADAESVQSDSELPGQLAAALDLFTALSTIILQDQFAIIVVEFSQASLQAVLSQRLSGGVLAGLSGSVRKIRDIELARPGLPMVFQEDEAGDHVAVSRGRHAVNGALLLQAARHTAQGFVGEGVRRQAVFPVEVSG